MERARRIVFYLLQFWLHLGYRFYFRRVILIGHKNVPPEHPVLLAPNHQNSFLDAMMTAIFVPQRFTFLARADVFKHPWFKKVMYLVSCLPAYRPTDGFSSVRNNEGTFEQCHRLLDKKESLLIFPEGNQEFGYKLRPLKKGLGRIALEYTVRTGNSVPVVPVGIHFEDYRAFNRSIVVAFGDSLPTLNFSHGYQTNPSVGLRRFTEALHAELNELCVSNDDADQKDKINRYLFSADSYYSVADWKEQVARVNDGTYLNDARALAQPKKQPVHWLGTPFAMAGLLLYILPYLAMRWLTNLVSPDKYFAPSVEFVVFLTLFPWWTIGWAVAIGILCSSLWMGVAALIVLPLLGKYYQAWSRGLKIGE